MYLRGREVHPAWGAGASYRPENVASKPRTGHSGNLGMSAFLGGSPAEVQAYQSTGFQEPPPPRKKPWALRGCFPEMAGEAPDCRPWSRLSVMPGIFTGEAWRRNGSSWPGNCQEEAHSPPHPPKAPYNAHATISKRCSKMRSQSGEGPSLPHTLF